MAKPRMAYLSSRDSYVTCAGMHVHMHVHAACACSMCMQRAWSMCMRMYKTGARCRAQRHAVYGHAGVLPRPLRAPLPR